MTLSEFTKKFTSIVKNEVFYAPSFGPVNTHGNNCARFLTNIWEYEKSDKILTYDKSIRWYEKRPEFILTDFVAYQNDCIYIPVVKESRKKTLKIYLYKENEVTLHNVSTAQSIIKNIKNIPFASVSFYSRTPYVSQLPYHSSILFHKQISFSDQLQNTFYDVIEYTKLPSHTASTFVNLTKVPDLSGAPMLWDMFLSQNRQTGTIYTAVINGTIVGYIGPLDVIVDPWGVKQLLAPYFEVDLSTRGHGVGTRLWLKAMDWAYRNGASYILLQSNEKELASRFYKKMGLKEECRLFTYTI